MLDVGKKQLTAAVCCAVASIGFVATAVAAENEAIASEKALENFYLAEVVVDGQRYIAGEYLRATSNVGILGEVDVMKTPISVNTISEKAIEDFISPTDGLAGLLSLVPSVQYAGNQAVDQVVIRGFAENGRGYLINGIPGMSAMNRQTSNYIDSIDIIEGPTSGITGSNAASSSDSVGGVININSKKATDNPVSKIGINYYSKSAFEETVDIGRRFGKNNEYGIRINAANVSGERGIDNWNLKQQNIYINLDRTTDKSKTNLFVGYVDTDSQGRPTYARLSSTLTGVPSAPDGSTNLNPDWRRDKYKQYIATLNHEQKFTDNFSAFINAGHYKQDWYYCLENESAATITSMDGTYTTSFEYYPLLDKNDYVQLGIKGKFKTDDLNHNYVISVDRQWRYYGGDWGEVTGSYIGNIYSSAADSWVNPGSPNTADAYYSNKYRMTGWSVMDTITAVDDKLTIMFGLNGKSYDSSRYNRSGEVTSTGAHFYDISPSYGVNYSFDPRFAAFAMHTEQFREGTYVQGGYTNDGTMLDPGKTKQDEIGIKFKTRDFYHKLSYFDIEKQNTMDVENADGTMTLTLNGRRRHRGIEYTATGALTPKWNLIGGFMYLNAEQVTSDGANGKRPNGVPEWLLTAGVEYKADDDFSVIWRGRYNGSSYIQNEKFEIPSYFRFDLGVKYKTHINTVPVQLRAMCYNVLDKHYWQPNGNNLYIGSPRTFMVSAEFDI